jgi:hypothetical protein
VLTNTLTSEKYQDLQEKVLRGNLFLWDNAASHLDCHDSE